jgi:hypothetical protein
VGLVVQYISTHLGLILWDWLFSTSQRTWVSYCGISCSVHLNTLGSHIVGLVVQYISTHLGLILWDWLFSTSQHIWVSYCSLWEMIVFILFISISLKITLVAIVIGKTIEIRYGYYISGILKGVEIEINRSLFPEMHFCYLCMLCERWRKYVIPAPSLRAKLITDWTFKGAKRTSL